MTPSLPTLSMTSATRFPIFSSWADRIATCAIWSRPSTEVESFEMLLRTDTTASSRPRLTAIGSEPAATFLKPSLMIACARTVDVVVPSPASSLVCLEASLRSCAPMFSNGSSRSISLAIETPSELTCGGPNFLSTITLRPFGPSVIFTVSASMSIPTLSRARASSANLSSFAGIFSSSYAEPICPAC